MISRFTNSGRPHLLAATALAGMIGLLTPIAADAGTSASTTSKVSVAQAPAEDQTIRTQAEASPSHGQIESKQANERNQSQRHDET